MALPCVRSVDGVVPPSHSCVPALPEGLNADQLSFVRKTFQDLYTLSGSPTQADRSELKKYLEGYLQAFRSDLSQSSKQFDCCERIQIPERLSQEQRARFAEIFSFCCSLQDPTELQKTFEKYKVTYPPPLGKESRPPAAAVSCTLV